MSGHRRKLVRSELSFKVEANPEFTAERAAELMAAFRANPAVADAWDPAERVALLRTVLIATQALMRPGVASGLGKRGTMPTGNVGRPKGDGSKWLAEYEFDTEHLETFREAGWANVPMDKSALYALAQRTRNSENTVKVALRRARKERRDRPK